MVHSPLLVLLALASAASASGTFLAITDIHLASDYVPGSTGPSFCTQGKGDCGTFGTFNCDSPRTLLSSALEFIGAHTDARFVLWLGDSPTTYHEHPAGYETEEMLLADMETVASEIARLAPAGARVFPNIGNHDCNGLPAPPEVPSGAAFLAATAKRWQRFGLSAAALESVVRGGYYTELLEPGARLVSMNTLYMAKGNQWAVNDTTGDIAGQWSWLHATLSAARAAGERVLLVGHVPPGLYLLPRKANWVPRAEAQFAALVEEFADVLVMSLFGHLHRDSFVLVRRGAGSDLSAPVVGAAVGVPSLSPRVAGTPPGSGETDGKNPSVRLFEYEAAPGVPFRVTDWVQYWANLTAGNAAGALRWEASYRASTEYGLSSFSAGEFEALARSLVSDKGTWCRFYKHWFVERGWPQCDAACRVRSLCSFLYGSMDAYSACTSALTAPVFVC